MTAAVIRFAYEAGHLKHLPRAGWQLAGVAQPESVAEHSFRVGILAYVIAALEGGNPDRAAAGGHGKIRLGGQIGPDRRTPGRRPDGHEISGRST